MILAKSPCGFGALATGGGRWELFEEDDEDFGACTTAGAGGGVTGFGGTGFGATGGGGVTTGGFTGSTTGDGGDDSTFLWISPVSVSAEADGIARANVSATIESESLVQGVDMKSIISSQ